MDTWKIGVIGGSGLYQLDELQNQKWVEVTTPWGKPSDAFLTGQISGVECVFLPRHGRGHVLGPSQLNYRANIDALKRLGVTDLISISAVGSLCENMAPGDFVVVDQLIDRTFARNASFFGEGIVAHVSMAEPVCPRMSSRVAEAAAATGVKVHRKGTYLAIEGPQFSTLPESLLYQQWGADVIGMTAMPEAKLAREAELPYALVGMVTDYDCWRQGEAPVEVSAVIAQLSANADRGRDLLLQFAVSLPAHREPSPYDQVLDYAVITEPSRRDPALTARLDATIGRSGRP
jgi:5'-methylthioadenosine phosphorylase